MSEITPLIRLKFDWDETAKYQYLPETSPDQRIAVFTSLNRNLRYEFKRSQLRGFIENPETFNAEHFGIAFSEIVNAYEFTDPERPLEEVSIDATPEEFSLDKAS